MNGLLQNSFCRVNALYGISCTLCLARWTVFAFHEVRILINPLCVAQRGYLVCVCVCVRAQSSTAGYEAPYERYQWIQNDKVGSCKKANVSKGLRSRDMVVPYPPLSAVQPFWGGASSKMAERRGLSGSGRD